MRTPFIRRIAIAIVFAAVGSWPSTGVCEDLDAPEPKDVTASKAYDYEHEYFSIRLGGGLLLDYVHYWQDATSEQQMMLQPESGVRDLRGLVSGRIIWAPLRYTVGLLYDVQATKPKFRQTGLLLRLEDQLGGFLFLGRTKEGFSTNKFMVGYYGWFNERSAANDAFLPILADGARWTGSTAGGVLVYNVGAFADPLSDEESFNKNDWQVAARVVVLPCGGDANEGMLHLAVEGRYAGANDGFLRYRSKPESFLAQSQAVDTGAFEASRSTIAGLEAYYVHGPLSSGGEYFVNKVSSEPENDPFFHGGEIFAAYLFTGETHPYKAGAGYFEDVVPKKTFFSGGPGAVELALRASYIDLDSENIQGGRFFRFTSLVNWYLTSALRFEASYAYGALDRLDLTGHTHFIQTRIQVQVK